FDFGTVKCVNAIHSSSMPDGSYGGNPNGFVITPKNSEQSFYYAGDTALTNDMRLISDEFEIKTAFLPIGDNYTMGIDDAVRCAEFVGTHTIIGLHYNTFPSIEIEAADAIAAFLKTGKNLLLPAIGESLDI
ncbi:MAG: MBL fold metallo-hydrolase, partial [Pseudomonadota bacterium]